jgi:hypothetical protein
MHGKDAQPKKASDASWEERVVRDEDDEAQTPAPPMFTDRDLQHAKHGAAILTACLVQTLNESDPSFQDRLLRRLTEAYYEVRDNSEGEVRHQLELLSWTRNLLTGWNWITGQGKPFLAGR